jgi:uncharacterized protein YqjF (DUF2071 family)
MLHYEVDAGLLRPLVPAGTELDLYQDRQAWISLVAFRFLDTQVLGVSVPLHRDFTEINLRFYVRRKVDGETRRGVVFLRELVAKPAIAWAARLTFNEPYRTADIREDLPEDGSMNGRLCYEWKDNGRWQSMELLTQPPGRPMSNGSLEEFLVDRGWGYTRQEDGGTIEYRVEHPRWLIWPAQATRLDCDKAILRGMGLPDFDGPGPVTAFAANGSAVTVYAGERIS